jgi:hypothetical protein
VALLLLAAPLPARPLPSGQAVGLAAGAEAGEGGGRPSPVLALEASRWLDGPLDAVAGLRRSATAGVGGRAVVTPSLGLRWSPSLGRWRPSLETGLGLALPLNGWSPSVAVYGGAALERLLGAELGLVASLEGRWCAGAGRSAALTLGARLYF